MDSRGHGDKNGRMRSIYVCVGIKIGNGNGNGIEKGIEDVEEVEWIDR